MTRLADRLRPHDPGAARELEGPLSRADEEELVRSIRADREPEAAMSERRLIQSNLRLVVSIARRYEVTGMPLLDIIQEGNLGLLQAVRQFDPEKGYRFSTFAAWWVRHRIQRAVGHHRL